MKNKLYICPLSKECKFNCPHKTSHKEYKFCNTNRCQWIDDDNVGKCIPYITSISAKKYSLKQLYNLWIEWGDKYDISFQKMFREYNLPGSFTNWLEKRERE